MKRNQSTLKHYLSYIMKPDAVSKMEASDLGVSFEKRITNVYTILYNSFDKEVQTLVLTS